MDPILRWCQSRQDELIGFLGELVQCESPSDSPEAVNRFLELFQDKIRGEATFETVVATGFGKHLLCTFKLPGSNKQGQVLGLGHSDTVWPMGTLASMPFEQRDGRLWGPGVLDMKAGLAFFVFAMRALRELDIPVPHNVVLQINSDEEVGSRTSRELTEASAKKSKAVLVLEPGTGLAGKAKTARKGIGDYRLSVRGVAAHAGVDFEKGASAVVEIAAQIGRIAAFTDVARGVTVNPGVISGGTRSNVIAQEASTHVDIRVPTHGGLRTARSRVPGPARDRSALHAGTARRAQSAADGAIERRRATVRTRAQVRCRVWSRSGRVSNRRRLGRQLHGGVRSPDTRRYRGCRRRGTCPAREHTGGPDRRSCGGSREAGCIHLTAARYCIHMRTQFLSFVAGAALVLSMSFIPTTQAQSSGKVYELRTYHCFDGKLEALKARFRDHTVEIFNRHHMKSVAYWVPQDEPASKNTLIYVLEHPSREEGEKNWKAFQADPDWVKARNASEEGGKIVEKVDRVWMTTVDFSPMK